MRKILILGAYGFFGNILSNYLKRQEFITFRQGRKNNADYVCDPNLKDDLKNLVDELNPDCIVNLIAETNVDRCESIPEIAFKANLFIMENIVNSIKNKNIFLIHLSTDQLYSGKGPHEESSVNPINEYAKTKYLSEKIAIKAKSLILRTNFVGKSISEKSSFTDWAVSSCLKKKEISLFNDVLFSPVHTSFLAEVIVDCFKKRIEGIFNLGSANGMSKYDFVKKITNELDIHNPNINITSVEDFKFIAKRPKDMRLNSKKFEDKFQMKVPSLNETLKLVIRDYKN